MYIVYYMIMEDDGLNMAPVILSWPEVKVQPLYLELWKERNSSMLCGFCFPLWRHLILHTGSS